MTVEDYNALKPGDPVVVSTLHFQSGPGFDVMNARYWRRGSVVYARALSTRVVPEWCFVAPNDPTVRWLEADDVCTVDNWAAQILVS